MGDSSQFTGLLLKWRDGDREAADRLASASYRELRRLAAYYMRREGDHGTLQATALVHELYLRLFAGDPVACKSRLHFYALAARQLRRILVNHARDRKAAKRGGGAIHLSLTEINGISRPRTEELLALDEALSRLEELNSRCAQVVELRFFGGLKEGEAAETLGVSLATIKRDWEFARAWLFSQLSTTCRKT
jgi:RNA polymerase sigma factor (TIGR02999 family)